MLPLYWYITIKRNWLSFKGGIRKLLRWTITMQSIAGIAVTSSYYLFILNPQGTGSTYNMAVLAWCLSLCLGLLSYMNRR